MTMRGRLLVAVVLFLIRILPAAAQEARETTLIPQTVYVGDRARLFVQLEPVLGGSARMPAVVDQAGLLPRTSIVHVHRVEIERRSSGDRAIIDFTAFEPGSVALPPVEAGGLRLAGLRVRIASSLAPDSGSELAPPEDSLAAPGTFVQLYGAIFVLLALIAASFLIAFRALPRLRAYLERRRRGLAARSLRRVLEKLASAGTDLESAVFLTILFDELRSYLTYRTGCNCHALTAKEIPLVLGESAASALLGPADISFLEALFRRGDDVRFGGAPASAEELRRALSEVGELIDRVEAAPC